MKQLLLFLAVFLSVTVLSAQDIIWQEDFSAGQHGWEAKTSFCDNFNGSEFGVWTLSSGMLDGEALDLEGGFINWSFNSPIEYSITFSDDFIAADAFTYGTVYSRYTMAGDTLMAMLDGTQVIGDGTAFSEQSTNGIVDWATNLQLDGEDPSQILRLLGVDQPIITFTNGGQNFTYASQDGTVTLEFSKQAECGSFWTWSPNGNVGYGALSQNPGLVINSATRANGVMVINTLFQNSQGDPAYSPGAPPYPQYISELISPPIDISAADVALSLELNQLMVYLNAPTDAPSGLKTSFSVSADDGVTWSAPTDINVNFPTNTIRNSRISVPIIDVYTQGSDEIRIKFTWATDFWYWAIDDISIVERVSYEMQANANFFGIAPNVNTPASQVEDIYWMSDIQNNGGVVAENVILNLTVVDESGTTELYNEDKLYGDIGLDSLAENDFFDTPLLGSTLEAGDYFGTYVLRHDSLDANTSNDSLQFRFTVTDTLFAKEEGRTRGIFLNARQWYIGNSFYVPNGDGWYARYISFMVDNASDAVNGTGVVNVLLYESDGDVNNDGAIDDTEYELIGLNEYTFDGSEDSELITVSCDLDNGLPLTSGKHYFAVIQYVGEGEDDQLAMSASEDNNYAANYFIMDSLMMPRYTSVTDLSAAGSPSFNVRGFGGDTNPVIRLSIGNNPDLAGDAIVAVDDILSDEYQMLVFPNPSDEDFKLQLDMPEQLDVNVRLFDQDGRMIFSKNYQKLDKGIFTYDVSKLPAGIYWVQLSTKVGMKTEKVIVSH